MTERPPRARFGRRSAVDLREVADLNADPGLLDRGGWWVVVGTFEGRITGYRFGTVTEVPAGRRLGTGRWPGPPPQAWTSSLNRQQYCFRVEQIRALIAAGDVYQVNLCRTLTADIDPAADPADLADLLMAGNPAPYAGLLDLGDDWIVSASPELFLSRDGDALVSAPIKGTAATVDTFADKDFAENIMITDLVRNDLGRIAVPGSVAVTGLLERQSHPGLAQLVSTVRARMAHGLGWADILAATFPPGSVSGAPKIRALQVISDLEPVERGVYCGAFGVVDADAGTARLAVGIRTFAGSAGRLSFGTGAGITWGSDPDDEWRETELKAARLLRLAAGRPLPWAP